MANEWKVCPNCGATVPFNGMDGAGATGVHRTKVRQYEGLVYGVEAHIVDIGYECWKCGCEFGFEGPGEVQDG